MAFTFPLLLWVVTLVAVLTIDLGAYLVAAARAQTLADASALAAVAADPASDAGRRRIVEAERVALAGGGQLVACDCRRRSKASSVTVSLPVPGLVLPTLGASRVAADARAVLAPPDRRAPGPTRERARWQW